MESIRDHDKVWVVLVVLVLAAHASWGGERAEFLAGPSGVRCATLPADLQIFETRDVQGQGE